jgi:cleavage and polyadenylation specificity factor subunit 1
MDVITHQYTVITSAEGLPYDCTSLLPCASTIGGVVILTSNCIVYVDQTSRRVALPVNGWPSRISDLPMPPVPPGDETRNLELEGARAAFVDDKTLFVVLKDGTVYPVEIVVDGKTVSRLTMGAALAQTTIPAIVERVSEEHLFVGSAVGTSVLLKTTRVEEEVESGAESSSAPAAVVDMGQSMDMDDDDGLCFSSMHCVPI